MERTNKTTSSMEVHKTAQHQPRCYWCFYGDGRHAANCAAVQKNLTVAHTEAIRRVLSVT